jgi:hypothetical protein
MKLETVSNIEISSSDGLLVVRLNGGGKALISMKTKINKISASVCIIFLSVAGSYAWGQGYTKPYMPPPAAISVLTKLYPEANLEMASTGDLDEDGWEDIAYVVKWRQDDKIVVGILRGAPDKTFEPWAQTKPYEMLQRTPEVSINKKLVYISTMNMGSNSGSWVTYKYSYRAKNFVLIGTDELYRSPRLDIDPGPITTSTVSTNFLSCLRIDVTLEGKKRTEKKSIVDNCKLEELQDFDRY